MSEVKPVAGSNKVARVTAEAPAGAAPTTKPVVTMEDIRRANPGVGDVGLKLLLGRNVTSSAPALQQPVTLRMQVKSDPAKAAIATAIAHLEARGIPRADVSARSVDVDELGMTHIRFDRTHGGIKVHGDQIIVHLPKLKPGATGDGAFVTGDFDLLPASILLNWKLTATDAEAGAIVMRDKKLAEKSDILLPDGTKPVVEKIIYRDAKGVFHGGYRVEMPISVASKPRRMVVLIDAQQGKPTESWVESFGVWVPREIPAGQTRSAPSVTKAAPEASPSFDLWPFPSKSPVGSGNDQTIYSGKVSVEDTSKGWFSKKFYLENPRAQTLDAGDKEVEKGTSLIDNNGLWGEARDSRRQRGAIDAHYGAQMTLDMYKNWLGTDVVALFGHALVSNVHVGKNYANAFWNGSSMSYGDGDGERLGMLTTLDIGGHEITHGVTQHTAGLIYRGQSGGLNEAFSDILGALVEMYAASKNASVKGNWSLGEQAWTPKNGDPTDALRYMNDPTKDDYSVDHYSKYPEQTEVHGSSGIANQAFYQLAEANNVGKTANSVSTIVVKDGVGVEKAGKIFFRALRYYLTPDSTFADARTATIRAATDLYGASSVEVKKTRESWSAVGVEDAKPTPLEKGLNIA